VELGKKFGYNFKILEKKSEKINKISIQSKKNREKNGLGT